MTFPFGALINQAAQARTAFSGGKAAAEQKGQQDQLSQALMLLKLKQDQQKDALAQSLGQANIAHLGAETKKLGEVVPRNMDPNGTEARAGKLADALTLLNAKPKPVARPESMIPGTEAWKQAQIDAAEINKAHGYHPEQHDNFSAVTIQPPGEAPIVQTYSTRTGGKGPEIGPKPTTAAGGLAAGSQVSVADMEQRLAEIKHHATMLAAGKGEITRPMQVREGLEYGIANQSAGGKGVPVKDALGAGAMDLFGAGGGPGDKTYDEYAALMNSQRAIGDDIAKVFKGRQNEDAVKREIALASLQPGDYKNPQVVKQKLSRMQNIIDLAKVRNPDQTAAPAKNPDDKPGNQNLGGGTATKAQQLWDAAVAKYGRDKVVAEVGERP